MIVPGLNALVLSKKKLEVIYLQNGTRKYKIFC